MSAGPVRGSVVPSEARAAGGARMGFAYVIVAILSAGVAVFALQNNTPLSVRFLGWALDGVPLAGAILGSLATGMLVVAIPLMISRWRWRRRARAAETK